MERIQSPILYHADKAFLDEMNELAISQYSKIATIHHYLSMAKIFVEELKESEEYKLKKFFYALRSSTACKWILEREEMPPIEFQKMLDELHLPSDLTTRIEELIQLKATISESYVHRGEAEVIGFMKSCIAAADLEKNSLPSSKGSMSEINDFFLKVINKNDH